MRGVPASWCVSEVGEIADLIRGVTYKKEQVQDSEQSGFFPVLRATNITGSSLTFDGLVFVPAENISDEQLLKHGDVVIASSSGSKEIVGKAGSFNNELFKGSFGAFCTGLRPSIEVSPSFFGYYFQTPSYRKSVSELSAGSNINNLKSQDLVSQKFPLPPIKEQTRIVAKLEELLSDLDVGVAELKAAQKKLAQYRQSLLKAAVEGALTAEWRAKNPPTETSAQLLERILTERRARWEAKQLAKFKEQGKTPPKDWQKKYPEPVKPDTEGLPELPEGWVWATINQLALAQKYGSSAKTNEDSNGIPVLRMGNIQGGELDFYPLKYLPITHNEFPDLFLEDGDMLFNRTNSPELVGKTAVYRSQISPCSYASYLISVKFTELFMPEFASTYINSAFGRNWVKSVVVQQVGQANVNGTKLAALAVPLPPLKEQTEIVATLETALTAVKEQQAAIELALKQSAAQRQNILRAAFSGQLVPQDPNDEPASVLLEHIRAEREKRVVGKRGRKVKEPI